MVATLVRSLAIGLKVFVIMASSADPVTALSSASNVCSILCMLCFHTLAENCTTTVDLSPPAASWPPAI